MDAKCECHIKLNQTQNNHVHPIILDLRLYVHIKHKSKNETVPKNEGSLLEGEERW